MASVNGSATRGADLEEPVQPGAVEDLLVRASSGLWPVAATTIPPIEEGEEAVMIGVTIPPARW